MANLKLENSQIHSLLRKAHLPADESEEPSNMTTLTTQMGRPEIDAVSSVSFDIAATRMRPRQDSASVLDSEVKGMDRFA